MPRRHPEELVYVLVAMDEDRQPATVEVHGTRSEAEFAGEELARREGYLTRDRHFSETGELFCTARRNGVVVGTEIFVLPRKIIRKPRVLKEKKDA